MDHYGIGTAILGAANIYLRSARGTGRTTSLLQSVKDGDRIITSDKREFLRLQDILKERQLNVDVKLIQPSEMYKLSELNTPQGRTLFDHIWIEKFYINKIQESVQDIDQLQTQLSGWSEVHEVTRASAAEMSRWQI